MGNMHLKLGNYSDASDTFRKVVEVKPSAMAYNNLGVSYLYMWDRLKQQKGTISQDEFMRKKDHILENASHAFKKSIELDANLFWAADSYVNVMFDRGLADVLEQEAEERLQTDKDDFASVYVLGKLRFLKNDFPGSTPYFDRAVKLNSSHKIVFFNFGYALTQIGDLDAAEQKYIQAIRIDPLFIEAYHNLGLVQYRKKDLRTSATNFLEVLRHEPKHISSNLYLARIRLQEGNRALAREHLQTILGVSPGHKDAVALLQQVGS
jgi:tetratricopeptide (TPR) repeat protein